MAKTPRMASAISASTLVTFRQSDLNPVGMIVSAMLTETQFQALNGTSWVLIDGRSVAGSLYATTTGITTLPDARGMVLRGKNSGGSALGTRADGGQNPDGDVALGTFQSDAMQGHNHELGYGSGSGGGISVPNVYVNQAPSWQASGIRNPTNDGTNGTPRTGSETRTKNITVNHFIKINS